MDPEDDARLLDFGIGFTDVVKTHSRDASSIKPSDYALSAPGLLERLERCGAGIICFHSITGYRAFARYALDSPKVPTPLGLQERMLGDARIFLAPNPGRQRALSRGRPGALLR